MLVHFCSPLKVGKLLQIPNLLSPAAMFPQEFCTTPEQNKNFTFFHLLFFFRNKNSFSLPALRWQRWIFSFHCKNCTQTVIFIFFLQESLLKCSTICSSSKPLALISALCCFESITQEYFSVIFSCGDGKEESPLQVCSINSNKKNKTQSDLHQIVSYRSEIFAMFCLH